jgi:hypothetical protein
MNRKLTLTRRRFAQERETGTMPKKNEPLHPARIVLALSLASEGKSALSSRGGWVISASTCEEGDIREIGNTVNYINVFLCIANALLIYEYFLFITLDRYGTVTRN